MMEPTLAPQPEKPRFPLVYARSGIGYGTSTPTNSPKGVEKPRKMKDNPFMIRLQQARKDILRMRHDSRWKTIVPEPSAPKGLIETLLEEVGPHQEPPEPKRRGRPTQILQAH